MEIYASRCACIVGANLQRNPVNWMALTARRPNTKKMMMVGMRLNVVPAINPPQSGAPCGVCDWNTAKPTVKVRMVSALPIKNGHK